MSIFGNTTDWSRALDLARERVENEFGSIPYNCTVLDSELKRLQERLNIERQKSAEPDLKQRAYVETLEAKKYGWESTFAQRNCRDIIENIRLQSSAIEQTKFAIKQEQSILGDNYNEQAIYIGIGAVVLLVGLFIVLNNNNNNAN